MIGRQLAVLLVSAGVAMAPVSAYATAVQAPAEDATESADGDGAATSADEARARELYNNGKRLYAEGSYEAAILAFKEGYELSKKPQFLYNIANAYERLGEFGQARDYYDQYRAYAPANQQEAMSRKIDSLDKRQREKDAAEAQERSAAAEAAREEERKRLEQEQADREPEEKVFGPAAWALTATAAVGFGFGIGFGVRANNKRDEALAECVEIETGRVCSTTAQEALDARTQSAIIADVGFVVGAIATIALISVVASKAAKKKRKQQEAAGAKQAWRVGPYAGAGGAGLVWTGRF